MLADWQGTPDEAPSRTRTHKGNVPSLPKTKQCSLCPAKFTRTTHLNRHLRSHTNERLHRCNICKSSEFTRSDLLTRHKRTCGQSVNRSRRKSCEACAESKIKCNLEHPCARCTSRGRECVFQNDPEESRNKMLSSKAGPRRTTSPGSHRPSLSSGSQSPLGESSRPGSGSPASGLLSLSGSGASDSSASTSSIRSSPRSSSGDLPTFDEHNPMTFQFDEDVGLYDPPMPSTSASTLLSSFDEMLFSCSPQDGYISLDGTHSGSALNNADLSALSVDGQQQDYDLELFASLIRGPDPPQDMSAYYNSLMMPQPAVPRQCVGADTYALERQCLPPPHDPALETYRTPLAPDPPQPPMYYSYLYE